MPWHEKFNSIKWSVLLKSFVPSSKEPPFPANSFSRDSCSQGPACYFYLVIICVRRDTTAPAAEPTVLGTPQGREQNTAWPPLPPPASVPSWESEAGGIFQSGREQMGGTGHLFCSDSHHLVQMQGLKGHYLMAGNLQPP